MIVLEAKTLCPCRGRCSPEQRKGGTSRSCPCLMAGQSCSTLRFCRRSLSKNLRGAVIILIGFLERDVLFVFVYSCTVSVIKICVPPSQSQSIEINILSDPARPYCGSHRALASLSVLLANILVCYSTARPRSKGRGGC